VEQSKNDLLISQKEYTLNILEAIIINVKSGDTLMDISVKLVF